MSEYYKSIRTIPVWNFYEVLNTGDYIHLYKDEPGKDDLSEVWKQIYDAYCTAAKVDNRHFKQIAKVEELRLKYYKISNLLVLSEDPYIEVRTAAKEALKGYNYLFRADQPHREELERLKRQLSALNTKISIEETKLPKESKSEAISLMKQAVSLENMFPQRNIDIYTMPLEKWIALWETAKEKINAQKQARKR